jgi:2-oxoglutarate dehydrogenase E1 component
VVLDIFCYRRFGHNEGDEPMFTKPLMYKAIKKHKTTLQLYTERLVADGLIPEGEIEDMKAAFQAHLNEEFEAGKDLPPEQGRLARRPLVRALDPRARSTSAARPRSSRDAAEVGAALTRVPEGFKAHKTVRACSRPRRDVRDRRGLRLGHGRGAGLRLAADRGLPGAPVGAGQHARHLQPAPFGLIDQETEERYYPLNHIRAGQARYEVIDSMLSEYAVLGFEYGYSLAEPNALVLWEAQFGDFANGAQIMFDQFISSGEASGCACRAS